MPLLMTPLPPPQLLETPPPAYRAYLNGWSAREERPTAGMIIHHGGGQPKQIALDEDPPVAAAFNAQLVCIRDAASAAAGESIEGKHGNGSNKDGVRANARRGNGEGGGGVGDGSEGGREDGREQGRPLRCLPDWELLRYELGSSAAGSSGAPPRER